MQNNIRNTNLRFNLGKEQQRRAWEYLQTMDRQDFKSYSQVISLALVDYFDRYYRTQADPYQSVIFCGQFNTCLSVSLPAPAFRFRSLNLSYPFSALWAIL